MAGPPDSPPVSVHGQGHLHGLCRCCAARRGRGGDCHAVRTRRYGERRLGRIVAVVAAARQNRAAGE